MRTGEVHVWVIDLDLPPERIDRLAPLLSDDEKVRAARFRGDHLSRRFIAGRAQLRTILAASLGREPQAIRFAYDEHGKPSLAPGMSDVPLEFNLSHSGGLAIAALAATPVGTDVEEVIEFPDMAGIAERFFSPAERRQLSAVERSRYPSAFYRCWTRKEAYLKAIGTGLLTPLDSFDVAIDEDARPALLRVSGGEDNTEWSLAHLALGERHIGAVALAGPDVTIVYRSIEQ